MDRMEEPQLVDASQPEQEPRMFARTVHGFLFRVHQHVDLVEQDPKFGFDIGWDAARLGVYPGDQLDMRAIEQGWRAGVEHFGHVPRCEDRFVRKWMQLRLSAYRRGRVLSESVTPEHLAEIDVSACPVTRETLTHFTGADTDTSVDRVNNEQGYVRGNLAVLSFRANTAKGSLSAHEMLRIARGLEQRHGPSGKDRGLTVEEWLRLATLSAFREEIRDPLAVEAWPLVAHVPVGLAVCNSGFVKKQLLTLQVRYGTDLEYGRLRNLLGGRKPMRVFDAFEEALAIQVAVAAVRMQGTATASQVLDWAFEDAWRAPLVLMRWRQLAEHLQDVTAVDLSKITSMRGGVEAVDGLALAREGGSTTRGWKPRKDL